MQEGIYKLLNLYEAPYVVDMGRVLVESVHVRLCRWCCSHAQGLSYPESENLPESWLRADYAKLRRLDHVGPKATKSPDFRVSYPNIDVQGFLTVLNIC